MGRHSRYTSPQAATRRVGVEPFGRYTRQRHSLPIFAFTAAIAFVFVLIFAPEEAPAASAVPLDSPGHPQSLSVANHSAGGVSRDGYSVTKRIIAAPPAVGVPAGEAQVIAYALLQARGWGDDQFSCLVSLWNRESHWSTTAGNPSGAYGIPQALPGSKMASAGPNWQTDATTQITWGLGYIAGRYGTPCGAWTHSEASNWY